MGKGGTGTGGSTGKGGTSGPVGIGGGPPGYRDIFERTEMWDSVVNVAFLVGRLHAAAFRWKQNGACADYAPSIR